MTITIATNTIVTEFSHLLWAAVQKILDVPKQELWRAVPSSGHILCVVGISPLREITCKAWQEKTEQVIQYNEELFEMLYMLRRLNIISAGHFSRWFLGFKGVSYEVFEYIH